jgi:hypothetical protein
MLDSISKLRPTTSIVPPCWGKELSSITSLSKKDFQKNMMILPAIKSSLESVQLIVHLPVYHKLFWT